MTLANWLAIALPTVTLSGTVGPNEISAGDFSAKLTAGPYFVDPAASLAASVITATLSPAPTSYTSGMWLLFRLTTGGPNTGAVDINVNALGAKDLLRADGTELLPGDLQANGLALCQYEAAAGKFRLISQPANPEVRFGKTAGTGSAYTLVTSPVLTALYNGATLLAHIHADSVAGGCTLAVDGLTAKSIKKWGNVNPGGADLLANSLALLQYNTDLGGVWLLLGSSYDAPTIYGETAGTGAAYTLTAPGPAALVAGQKFRLKIHAVSAATPTFNFTPTGGAAIGPVEIKGPGGTALPAGALATGSMIEIVHDGTFFQLVSAKKEFVSAPQALPAVSTLTSVAHGLGAAPKAVRAVARCVTPELGYVANDEIDLINVITTSGGTSDPHFHVQSDATNVNFIAGSVATRQVRRKDAPIGTSTTITDANWNLKVYASL